MNEIKERIRPAAPGDADALAVLTNYAGEGLPLYLWERLAEPGQDAWAVGRERATRREGSFSYRNASVIDIDGKVVACLIGYLLPTASEPIDTATMPPIFVPLQELENLASGTWYVNVIAVDPALRGRGLGTRLLTLAERYAVECGAAGLSLIVGDGNAGARRLYEQLGYREAASRAMVKDGWQNDGENWVLLIKKLDD